MKSSSKPSLNNLRLPDIYISRGDGPRRLAWLKLYLSQPILARLFDLAWGCWAQQPWKLSWCILFLCFKPLFVYSFYRTNDMQVSIVSRKQPHWHRYDLKTPMWICKTSKQCRIQLIDVYVARPGLNYIGLAGLGSKFSSFSPPIISGILLLKEKIIIIL